MKTAPNRALWPLLAVCLILATSFIVGSFRRPDVPVDRRSDASEPNAASPVHQVPLERTGGESRPEDATASLANTSRDFEELPTITKTNTKPEFSVFVSQPVTPRLVKVPA